MVFVLRHVKNGEVLILGMDETYTLGRSRRNKIHLKDATVNKKHATIKLAGGQVDLEDENSASGTWVNKERIRGPRRLQSGDVILFGEEDCKYVFLDPKFEGLIDERIEDVSRFALELTLKNLNVKIAADRASTFTHFITKLVTVDSLMNGPILNCLIDRKNVITIKYFMDILTNIREAPLIPNIYRYMPQVDDFLKSKGIVDINPRKNRNFIFDNVFFIIFDPQLHDRVCPLIVKCGGDTTIYVKGFGFYNNLFENWSRYLHIAVLDSDQSDCEQMKQFSETMRLKGKRFMTIEPRDIYVQILKGHPFVNTEDSEVVCIPNTPTPVIILDSSDDEELLPEFDNQADQPAKPKSPNIPSPSRQLCKSYQPLKNELTFSEFCLRANSQSSTLNKWITSPKKKRPAKQTKDKTAIEATMQTEDLTASKEDELAPSAASSEKIKIFQVLLNRNLPGSLDNSQPASNSADNSRTFIRSPVRPTSLSKKLKLDINSQAKDVSDCSSSDSEILLRDCRLRID